MSTIPEGARLSAPTPRRRVLAAALVLAWTATNTIGASEFDVVISEIHYHPFGPSDPTGEFIELYNSGLSAVAMAGWRFVSGVDFEFPESASLAPGEYAVVAATVGRVDVEAGVQVFGPYAGRLDNDGETLILADAAGREISRVHYRDGPPWSVAADGAGPSLERALAPREIHAGSDADRAQVWRASRELGGTPGRANTRSSAELPFPPDRPALQIVEVAVGADGFVELLHRSGSTIDVSGYSIVNGAGQRATIAAGTVAPPGDPLAFDADRLGFAPALDTEYILFSESGEWVDTFAAADVPPGRSIGRIALPAGLETGRDEILPLLPSPGVENRLEFSGAPVVVHEVFYGAAYEEPAGDCIDECEDRRQWIELHNPAAAAAVLTGWSLTGGIDFDFPADASIAAGGYLVVCASLEDFAAEYPEVENVVGDWDGRLGHRSDRIVLRDALGIPADTVRYGSGRPGNDLDPDDGVDDGTVRLSAWPPDIDGSDRSIELVHPRLENASGDAWRAGEVGGTPGAANGTAEEAPLAVVFDVTHVPPVPDAMTPVRVECAVDGVTAIDSVAIEWKIDGAEGEASVAAAEPIPGTVGPAEARRYTAEIPPQASGSVVSIRIVVRSGDVDASYPLAPPAAESAPAFLYAVDDAPPLANGAADYRIILTAADLERLRSRDVQSNVLLHGTFIGDGAVHHLVGVRYRGENSRNRRRKSYRVAFPPERPFQGIERLNLNAGHPSEDVPDTQLREYLSLDLFRRAGLPASQAWPVNLYFPGGVENDLPGRDGVNPFYVRKEAFDRNFLRRYYEGATGGNLYRARDPAGRGSGDLSFRSLDPLDYVPFYEKETRRDAADYSDLVELARVFSPGQTPDSIFEAELHRVLDVEQWARFFAVQAFLTNVDGGIHTNNGEDYALYHFAEFDRHENAGRWVILPWDLEETFRSSDERLFRPTVAAIERFLSHPGVAPLYLGAVEDLRERAAASTEFAKRSEDYSIYAEIGAGAETRRLRDRTRDRAEWIRQRIVRELSLGITGSALVGDSNFVPSGALWRYFPGTAEPSEVPLDWTTLEFSAESWLEGAGGFGYGDDDDQTILDDMENSYSSLYIRREFTLSGLENFRRLVLTMDYDDAYVAYLNGVEIARSANLDGFGEPGEPLPYDLILGNDINHEASAGSGDPPERVVFDNVTDIVREGENVLAVHALNSTIDSSDFTIIASLRGVENVENIRIGWSDPLVTTHESVTLSGLADPVNARSVTIGGALARTESVPPAGDTPYAIRWSAEVELAVGTNEVAIEMWTGPVGDGERLERRDVRITRVADVPRRVGGALTGDVAWTADDGPYLVDETIVVEAGASLAIGPGTEVYFGRSASVVATGRLEIRGTAEEPVVLRPQEFGRRWEGIAVRDSGIEPEAITHTIEHVDLRLASGALGANAAVEVRNAKLTVSSSRFSDLSRLAIEGIDSVIDIDATRFERTDGAISTLGTTLRVRDSQFVDTPHAFAAIAIDGDGPEPSAIENCDLLAGWDGIVARASSVRIESNRIADFCSEGIALESVGALGLPVVRGNELIRCATAIAIDAIDGLAAHHNSIVSSACALRLIDSRGEQDPPAYVFVLHSSILWSVEQAICVGGRWAVAIDHSLLDGTDLWPGQNILREDPRFVEFGADNLALAGDSPCRRAGRDGSDMGATGVGGPPPPVTFVRGDANADSRVNIADAIAILEHLFQDFGPLACQKTGDANDDGGVNIADAISLLNFLFLNDDPPPPPFPEPGEDPTPDELDC